MTAILSVNTRQPSTMVAAQRLPSPVSLCTQQILPIFLEAHLVPKSFFLFECPFLSPIYIRFLLRKIPQPPLFFRIFKRFRVTLPHRHSSRKHFLSRAGWLWDVGGLFFFFFFCFFFFGFVFFLFFFLWVFFFFVLMICLVSHVNMLGVSFSSSASFDQALLSLNIILFLGGPPPQTGSVTIETSRTSSRYSLFQRCHYCITRSFATIPCFPSTAIS